ncbi:predicted protein [Chaetoceros tenuissimus]|uniref:Uncharacterized protein n=1 Tax=Chaetoceros tenuissimus TaxID=426638 RepID=A0AAD3CQF4_9STRA|nr:predicted protein [Chaetoceros tenuissimus]
MTSPPISKRRNELAFDGSQYTYDQLQEQARLNREACNRMEKLKKERIKDISKRVIYSSGEEIPCSSESEEEVPVVYKKYKDTSSEHDSSSSEEDHDDVYKPDSQFQSGKENQIYFNGFRSTRRSNQTRNRGNENKEKTLSGELDSGSMFDSPPRKRSKEMKVGQKRGRGRPKKESVAFETKTSTGKQYRETSSENDSSEDDDSQDETYSPKLQSEKESSHKSYHGFRVTRSSPSRSRLYRDSILPCNEKSGNNDHPKPRSSRIYKDTSSEDEESSKEDSDDDSYDGDSE